jgi:hypothetical protein
MSADVLRRAASKLRELAGTATPGPWIYAFRALCVDTGRCGGGACDTGYGHEPDCSLDRIAETSDPDAAYISAMSPSVGLAVADWLDGVAHYLEARADDDWLDLEGDPIAPEDTHAIGSALAVARAVLGEPS